MPTDDLQGRCRSMNSCLSRMTGRPCSDDCRSATLQMSFSCASDRFTRPSAHIHPDRQTDRQTDKQTDSQTEGHSTIRYVARIDSVCHAIYHELQRLRLRKHVTAVRILFVVFVLHFSPTSRSGFRHSNRLCVRYNRIGLLVY